MKEGALGGKKPPFLIIISGDSGLLADEIESRLAATAPAKWQKQVFWGDDDPGNKLWDSLAQMGLFADNRAVVLRNAQDLKSDDWRRLSSALASVPDFIWPFICIEVDWEKGKYKLPAYMAKAKCMAYAEKNGCLCQIPPLAGAALRDYAKKAARKLNLVFDTEALRTFCEFALADARSITSEMQKLALICPNGRIAPEMIGRDAANAESNAFVCVGKLQRGDLHGAWAQIAEAKASDLLFPLIGLLARECRTLWQIRAGANPWIHPSEVEFKRKLAVTMGFTGISAAFCLLADAEWQVKSGRQSPEQALEQLVAHAVGIFQPQMVKKIN